MTRAIEPHDVFISYAREDLEWVRDHLYEPLRKCRTKSGRPPRIFFDLGEDGVQFGESFFTAINRSIEVARKFVPVYSTTYFKKDMCIYELELAHTRDENFRNMFMLPILKDPEAASDVPFQFKRLNYRPVSQGDWFSLLCNALNLQTSSQELELEFHDQPGDVFENHTLPVVRVSVLADNEPFVYETEVRLQAQSGHLLGTTAVKTIEGIAAFDDLSIGGAIGANRLIATCESLRAVESDDFHVHAASSPDRSPRFPTPPESQASIPAVGECMFFETGDRLAILQNDAVIIASTSGDIVSKYELPAPIRFSRRSAEHIALADWRGNIHLLHQSGEQKLWKLGEKQSTFAAPADVDFTQDCLYAAMLNGSVYRLEFDGKSKLVHKEPAGVQAIGVFDEFLFVTDFSGNMRVYHHQKPVSVSRLEDAIWLFVAKAHSLVAVGDQFFYHISVDDYKVYAFEMPLSEIASVYEATEFPIVVDVHGKGLRFDDKLTIVTSFSVQPGAEPVSADDAGLFFTFRNPDGAHTLFRKNRVVFSQSTGSIAVNAAGDCLALGDGSQTRIIRGDEFRQLIDESGNRSAGEGATSMEKNE